MAVTSIWPIKGRVDKVINYARNPEKTHDKEKLSELHEIEGVVEYAADEMKTEKRAYVTCLHLHSEETAAQEFMETKRLMHNEGGRFCYHGYQSFKADEVDADTAHSIGVALARELWGDRFQVVIATHCNTGHYHNHFVINSVSDVDGNKFYSSPADYRRMRAVSDQLCREAKISVIEYPADRRANYGEWLAEKNGKPTMRNRIREDIDRAILASTTEREFQRVMKEMGYEVITKMPKGSPRVHPIVRIVDGGETSAWISWENTTSWIPSSSGFRTIIAARRLSPRWQRTRKRPITNTRRKQRRQPAFTPCTYITVMSFTSSYISQHL